MTERSSQPTVGNDRDDDFAEVREPGWMRFLEQLERLSGRRWPWGQIWLGKGVLRGCAFHFASGVPTGFAVTLPLPRMLPGFVRPYQVQELRTRAGRRRSDLHFSVPVFPPGLPSASRTMRLRARRANASATAV